jgi:hypothetical protein
MYIFQLALISLFGLCCLGTKHGGTNKAFHFSSEDFDSKDWKDLRVFDSGPIETNELKPYSLNKGKKK